MKGTHLKTWTRQPRNLRQQFKLQKLEFFFNFPCKKGAIRTL